jgi:hypothetical protein
MTSKTMAATKYPLGRSRIDTIACPHGAVEGQAKASGKPVGKPRRRKHDPIGKHGIESESCRQSAVIKILRSLGYTVLEIAQKRQPIFCKCGAKHWPITTGNTSGVSDLLVSRPGWQLWLSIEMKTPITERRPKQIELNEMGLTVIVETVEEAVQAVDDTERRLRLTNRYLTAYMEQISMEQIAWSSYEP